MEKDNYFQSFLSDMEWLLQELTYDTSSQLIHESLFTLGNGYVGSRGALEEGASNSLAGTFFAGVYEESVGRIAEMINAPNPFHLAIDIFKTEKLDISSMPFEKHKRILDMKKGILSRQTVYKTQTNHLYDYQSLRFISHHNPHVAVLRVVLTPLTKKTHFTIDCSIDTSVKNHGIIMEHDMQDFQIIAAEKINETFYLSVESLDHKKEIAYGQQVFLEINGKLESISTNCFDLELEINETAVITKIISFYAARNPFERTNIKEKTIETLRDACHESFDELLENHVKAIELRWQQYDIEITEDYDIQLALRFNLFQLICVAPRAVQDVSVGAKLLTGEGYKGHIFWEAELLLLPCYLFSEPPLARSLLEYRFNRLNAAKELAASRGHKGALFPWESAETGKDETPPWTEDIDSTVKIVHTGKQSIHINLAVFYAIDLYFLATHDINFMFEMGLPMMIEMARFWKSRVIHNKKKDIYKINHVMGPDEFHENINNNFYTNQLVVWSILRMLDLLKQFNEEYPNEIKKLLKRLKFYQKEIDKLLKIATKMWLPTKDKIIIQFDNYLELKHHRLSHLDVFGLPAFPPDLLPIDLYRTQLVKQADVVLLLLLLPWLFDKKTAAANFHFYDSRTLHLSSWSPPIYSAVAAQIANTERAYHYLVMTLNLDKKNMYGNTQSGLHMPSVAGSWIALVYGFLGIRLLEDRLLIAPSLPHFWQSLKIEFHYLDFLISLRVSRNELQLQMKRADCSWLKQQGLRPQFTFVKIQIGREVIQIVPDHLYTLPLQESFSCFDLIEAPDNT